jgi:hypothetical protein
MSIVPLIGFNKVEVAIPCEHTIPTFAFHGTLIPVFLFDIIVFVLAFSSLP